MTECSHEWQDWSEPQKYELLVKGSMAKSGYLQMRKCCLCQVWENREPEIKWSHIR